MVDFISMFLPAYKIDARFLCYKPKDTALGSIRRKESTNIHVTKLGTGTIQLQVHL